MKKILLEYLKSGKLIEIVLMIGAYFLTYLEGDTYIYFLFLLVFIYILLQIILRRGKVIGQKERTKKDEYYYTITFFAFICIPAIEGLYFGTTTYPYLILLIFISYICYHIGLIINDYLKIKKKN